MTIKNTMKNFLKAGVMKMNPNKRPKPLTVINKQAISDNFLRLTFSFEDASQFPENPTGQYVKLLFTPEGNTDISSLEQGQRPMMRTYTIRSFDAEQKQLVIDFVKHTSKQDVGSGLAGHWAVDSQIGDVLMAAGPGPRQPINTEVDTVILAADMTAIPALAATLANLPASAQGHAFIQVTSESDIQTLEAPQGIKFEWIVSAPASDDLAKAVAGLPTTQGSAAIWCAAEFSQMRAIRRHISDNWDIRRESSYFSSYWKQGVTEDGHKALKSQDSKEFSAK